MILKRLKIETMIGSYTNCYVIEDEKEHQAIVIDPAGEPEKIIETLELLNTNLKYIYLTHCHADHTAGLKRLKEATNACVLIHRIEYENLQDKNINLSAMVGIEDMEVSADSRVDDGDIIHVGEIEFEVIHTPGHTSRRQLFILQRT